MTILVVVFGIAWVFVINPMRPARPNSFRCSVCIGISDHTAVIHFCFLHAPFRMHWLDLPRLTILLNRHAMVWACCDDHVFSFLDDGAAGTNVPHGAVFIDNFLKGVTRFPIGRVLFFDLAGLFQWWWRTLFDSRRSLN